MAEAEWFKFYFYSTKDQAWLARTAEAETQAELRNPDLAAVHRILGLLIYNSGRYDQAVSEYQRAIELDPNNSDGYRRMGMAYQANNDIDKALAAYHRAAEVEPGYMRNQQALGDFWFRHDNYEESMKYFAKCVASAPRNLARIMPSA